MFVVVFTNIFGLKNPGAGEEIVQFDRHPPGHNATASCQTLPSREDYQSHDMKSKTILLLTKHCVQDTTKGTTPTPTPLVDAPSPPPTYP